MTATAVAAEELLALRVGDLDREAEQVQHTEPDGEAPHERHCQPEVDASGVPLRGLHRHSVTILSTIVAVQGAWLAALAYGLIRFVL